MLKTAICAILLAAVVIACNSCEGIRLGAQAERTDTLSAGFGEGYLLAAVGINGGITVEASDTDECVVEVTITGVADTDESALALIENVNVTLDVDEDARTMTLAPPEDLPSDVSVSYFITVPQKTSLQLDTGNGGIDVTGITGSVRARTSNAPVSCYDITGNLDIGTSNGGIYCETLTGDFLGRTSNARVTVEFAPGGGNFQAKTSNGSVKCTGARGSVGVVTSNGGVTIEYAQDAPADPTVDVKTSNASITLTLPAAFAGDVRADTSNGRVQSARDFTSVRESDGNLDATIGSGGKGVVKLDTSNGPIDIE